MKNQFHHENLSRKVQMAGQMRGGCEQNVLVSGADASRLHKGLSLPSRRLVPCILAALTASAVTLGALPSADAAPPPVVRSAVTEDITAPDGIAGSIDGSAATITVGREGGSTSPQINGGFGLIYGSYYSGTVPSFTLTGGRAIIHSGTMYSALGGIAKINVAGTAEVTGSSIMVTGGTIQGIMGGGFAQAATPSGAVYAAARGNVVDLRGGSYGGDIYGGYANANSNSGMETAIAENNIVRISGGTYNQSITAGWARAHGIAIARNNILEITGAPGLSLPGLMGGYAEPLAANRESVNNALILRHTKNITARNVDYFQRYAFYVPADFGANDTMLTLTSTASADLSGARVEAYVPGGITVDEVTLLHTPNASITTDAATKMTVYEGISGTLANAMYVDSTGKKLLVRRDGAFQFTGADNAKSLAETMAGAAAFLGTGAHLFTGPGISSASIEAAAASGFAPFAALDGASLRYETGSHVEMTGMNLVVGFSRELKRGNDRLLFGPLVEYGRGSYDSYVNAVHGDGTVWYLGVGGFVRREQTNGMFYEGSLRFGRSDMDYAADIRMGSGTVHTSYDTDANYIGAHLGIGQQVTAKNGTEREMYLRYFYTRQDGASATLSTGDRYDFSAVDSHRLRTGVRWTMPQTGGALILGTSVQYEFGGDTSATYHRPGGLSYTSPSPSLKGFSGSLEVGWKAAMSENATANVAVEGWMGKQRGVSLNAGFEWMF